MINLIAAISKNGVIGNNGTLPWRIPEDLKRFKQLTSNGLLFVGKTTAANLPLLPGREVITLNRDAYPTIKNVESIAKDKNKTAWIAGGALIYKAALELDICEKIYLTVIDKEYVGDTYFPLEMVNFSKWILLSEEILRTEPLTTLQIWDGSNRREINNDSYNG